LSWLMWQMGSAPFMGGGFGHFYHYAPFKIEYAIDRYAMETKRLFSVADRRLGEARFLAGDDYSIADIAAYVWLGNLYRGEAYGEASTFLSLHEYTNVGRWVGEIDARKAVQRGRMVNRGQGPLELQLRERHDASDFELRTQDKLEPAES
jgi:GSH-dependent disulfide-bond oxidoreductase